MRFSILFFLVLSAEGFCPPKCKCSEDSEAPSVDCTGAGLTSIPILLNPRIRSLSLRNNRISMVAVEELSIYSELDFLDLSFNRILSLDRGAFYRLSQLQVLRLDGNQLESLQIETFAGLAKLKILDLSQNRMGRLATSVFANLRQLEVLNLSNNLLRSMSPGALTGLTALTALHLEQNQLLKLNAVALRAPTALKLLDLSFNDLKSLPNDSFTRLADLELLNLSGNSIEAVDVGAFVGLRSLLRLDLSFNRLYRIPGLSLLTELRELDIGANLFDAIPTSSFEGLQSLRQLSVEQCAFLVSVQLNAFSGLGSLETLSLARNPHLASIHPLAFETPNQLRRVFLAANAFTSLPDILLDWSRLESLDLRQNPWNCNCDFRWMSRVLADVHSDAVCAAPEKMVGVRLDRFESELSGCSGSEDPEIRLVLTIAIVASALFSVSLLLFLLFRCRKRICPSAASEPIYARSDILYSSECSKKSLIYAGFTPQFYGDTSPNYVYHSIPSSRATQSSTLSDSFRVIKDYPVPITEL